MSMERRALIAFVLSMALFLVYDAVYLGPKTKHEREQRQTAALAHAHRDSLHALSDTLAARELPPPAVAAPVPADTVGRAAASRFASTDTTEHTIVVASPLYEITLSSRGGEIVDVRLMRYLTHGQPVDLLPGGESWSGDRMLAATLKTEHESLPLSDLTFEITDAGGHPVPDGARIEVSGDRPVGLDFKARGRGGTIERTFRFYADRYDFEAGLRAPESALPGGVDVTWSFGPGLAPTEPNLSDEHRASKASVLLGEEFHRKGPHDFGREHVEQFAGTLNWASLQTKYFLAAIFPTQPTRAEVEMSGVRASQHVTQRITLPARSGGGEVTQTMRVLIGPLDYHMLEAFGIGLEKDVEFGWKWLRPLSAAVLWAMTKLYRVIPNYGWVIIIISVLAKVLFYRLTHKSFKSMKEMQALQPRLQALKEKFGDDKRRVSEETMKLYKEAGVNPLGGCLPMLLQMPVFIALYTVLRYNIALRGAPFVGWISDLSQQDVLFKLPIHLPFIGNDFSLLPIIMGGSMWAQSKLGGSPTGAASPMPAGYNTLLPIVFTVLFYRMPSGLVIYWIINTVLSVVQQYYIHRTTEAPVLSTVEEAPRKRNRARKG